MVPTSSCLVHIELYVLYRMVINKNNSFSSSIKASASFVMKPDELCQQLWNGFKFAPTPGSWNQLVLPNDELVLLDQTNCLPMQTQPYLAHQSPMRCMAVSALAAISDA